MITEIVNFTNGMHRTPISPTYKCSIISGYLSNSIDLRVIGDIILEKEDEITKLELPPELISHGGTGLGPESLTSRFRAYNVLTWNNPHINELKKQIRFYYDIACDYHGIDKRERVYVQCWANVLRKGEKMSNHRHSSDSDEGFLSGHITVKCDNTRTVYENPYSDILNQPEYYYFINEPGKINIFQSNIYHYTTEHMSDSERITIAFDIFWKNYPPGRVCVEL